MRVSKDDITVRARWLRNAIEQTRDEGGFSETPFECFPFQCCDDASCIMAHVLQEEGIDCLLVSGYSSSFGNHMWLVVDDDRVSEPTRTTFDATDECAKLIRSYGSYHDVGFITYEFYTPEHIAGGLIVDITADQFGEASVYVGECNSFYEAFDVNSIQPFHGLSKEDETLFAILANWSSGNLNR